MDILEQQAQVALEHVLLGITVSLVPRLHISIRVLLEHIVLLELHHHHTVTLVLLVHTAVIKEVLRALHALLEHSQAQLEAPAAQIVLQATSRVRVAPLLALNVLLDITVRLAQLAAHSVLLEHTVLLVHQVARHALLVHTVLLDHHPALCVLQVVMVPLLV